MHPIRSQYPDSGTFCNWSDLDRWLPIFTTQCFGSTSNSTAVGHDPASQAVAGPEFVIFPSNLTAYWNKTMKAIVLKFNSLTSFKVVPTAWIAVRSCDLWWYLLRLDYGDIFYDQTTAIICTCPGNSLFLFDCIISCTALLINILICNFLISQAIKHEVNFLQQALNSHFVAVIVCTISFERPVNYLCDAWHVSPPKYEAWTHFNN